ncbi:rRNA adenine N-6-methyltransferase family protein [uncultured Parolsenella sp.]|uniref:ribosomal RNA small subunit methyltransferase A n=1 Tax=uncultured Parolsenella sp. TaxID=2083008 RepID=UPI0027D98735|nr:rRNA adenine N-6-methyltransferase family protein [uncultured Parolsenella sp.]
MPASPLANPTATRQMLERFGLATKHRLGQNFLVDDNVIAKILELARLDETSSVLEVGPGIGTLTLGMLPLAGSVVSIEADRELEPVLADLAHAFPNFAYVMGDALRVSADEVHTACGRARQGEAAVPGGPAMATGATVDEGGPAAASDAEGGPATPTDPAILVANLPYNVAATIILKYLSERPSLAAEVVMVQAEVADRICARPGTKAYGAYTAKLSLYGEVTGRFEVPPTCFMPAPHVNSAVVRIDRSPVLHPGTGEPLSAERIDRTCEVIDAAFAQRRKTIRNSMAARGFEKSALDEAFSKAGIAPTSRAEALSPDDFVRLACALEE